MNVYVIGPDSGAQKVGVALDPARRLTLLQTGNPTALKLWAAVPVEREMGLTIELYAHRLLQAHHARGEWFNVTPEHAEGAIHQAIDAVRAGLEMPGGLPRGARIRPPPHRTFPLLVVAARGLLGWTQDDLSRQSGVSLATVKNYERGTTDIRNSTVGKIEVALKQAGVALINKDAPSISGGSGVRLDSSRLSPDRKERGE